LSAAFADQLVKAIVVALVVCVSRARFKSMQVQSEGISGSVGVTSITALLLAVIWLPLATH
jgi:hypothetical protein